MSSNAGVSMFYALMVGKRGILSKPIQGDTRFSCGSRTALARTPGLGVFSF